MANPNVTATVKVSEAAPYHRALKAIGGRKFIAFLCTLAALAWLAWSGRADAWQLVALFGAYAGAQGYVDGSKSRGAVVESDRPAPDDAP